jgi:hypothetical protein
VSVKGPIARDVPLIIHDLIHLIASRRAAGAAQGEIDGLVAEYRALRAKL